MVDDLDIIAERDGMRVRLEYDDSPEQPYDDGATPILTLERSGYGGYRVAAFNSQAEPYVSAVAEVLDRHDMETVERFVKIFYGAVKLDSWYSDGLRGYYVAFDTADWREKVGAPVDRLAAEDYLSEVRAWAEGDVYGYIVERRYAEDGYEDEDSWEAVADGSCWGFYGRQWAEQAAREALETALENNP